MSDAAPPLPGAVPDAALIASSVPLDEHDDASVAALLLIAVVATVAGLALALTARAGAGPLLAAIAVVQAVFALAWVLGTVMPGRRGGLVLAALASTFSDVAVSVWPHSRLGTLLAVLGLAVPALFVAQLARGAARRDVLGSLGAGAVVVVVEVALPALVQLRHEFPDPGLGGRVVAAVVAAAAAAVVVGALVDMVAAVPRFDVLVPRGLLGLAGATGVGGSVGYLVLGREFEFVGGRAVFVGLAVGVLSGLLAIATTFALVTSQVPASGAARRLRAVVGAVVPIALVSPAAFLLCLVIRT